MLCSDTHPQCGMKQSVGHSSLIGCQKIWVGGGWGCGQNPARNVLDEPTLKLQSVVESK